VAEFLHHLWWPGKMEDIENYVQSCIVCARRKGNYGRNSKPNMGHLLRGTKPFEIIYCDFVHMPQSPNGKRYILTIIDSFTRFFFGYPTARDRAVDAARGLLHFMLDHEIPRIISSDRGTHFVNAIIEKLCQDMGIKQNLHTAWRPQSSGNIERAHRSLKNALWATAIDRKCSWEDALPYVRRAMNMAKNSATGCSPYYAIYGREPILCGVLAPGVEDRSTEPLSYGATIQQRLQCAHKMIIITNNEADNALERRDNPIYPADELYTNDYAYLYRPESTSAKESHLSWIGPYKVLESNQQIVKIERCGNEEWVHRNHLVKHIARRPDLEVEQPPEESPISDESESGRADHTTEQVVVVNSDSIEAEEEVTDRIPSRIPRRIGRDRRPPRRLSPRLRGKTHGVR